MVKTELIFDLKQTKNVFLTFFFKDVTLCVVVPTTKSFYNTSIVFPIYDLPYLCGKRYYTNDTQRTDVVLYIGCLYTWMIHGCLYSLLFY